MRRIFLGLATTVLILIFMSTVLRPAPVAAGDGIPDNCEYTSAAYYQANIFPRYEPQNQRLILVDWATGADVRTLGENLPDTRITGWSPDCRYLAGAVYNADSIDTMVWDASTGANMGTVPDAHQQPHHLTWGPGNYLVVETRDGAILWNVPAGNRVPLTSTSDGNGRSFKNGVFDWDFANNQLHTWLSIPPYGGAIYDLETGALLGISDKFGRAFSTESTSAALAQAADSDAPWCKPYAGYYTYYGGYSNFYSSDGFGREHRRILYESYNRRIAMIDGSTRETIQVIEEGVETGDFRLMGFSPDCRFMGGGLRDARGRYSTIIWDLSVDPVVRVQSADNAIWYPYNISWSPDSAYAIVSGRNTGYLWNLLTRTEFRLTPEVDEDCAQFPLGCVGSLFSLRGVYWDTPGQVHIGVIGGAQVSIDLATGEAVGYIGRAAQAITPYTIEARRSTNYRYRCNATVRYEPYNRRLAIHEWNTGQLLRVVEDNLEFSDYFFEGWSPNCTYVVAAIGPRADSDTVIWNLATNTRVGVFENAINHPHYFDWTPDSSAMLIQTRNGAYLWYMVTDERVLLSEAATDDGRNFYRYAWDTARGQLLAVTVGAPNVVTAYDMHSGQLIRTYPNGSSDAQLAFKVLADGYHMTVWPADEHRQAEGFTLWNLSDGSALSLTTGRSGLPDWLKFSTSGRYIALGWTFWDLQNLAPGEYHPPTYVRDFGDSRGLTFESDQIVLTYHTSADKYDIARRRYHLTTYRWDLATGTLLSESEETKGFSGYDCCAIPSS